MNQIMDDMPPDPTDLEDMIHSALFYGNFNDILENTARLDPWLAAHLADLMDALSLISPNILEYVCSDLSTIISLLISH